MKRSTALWIVGIIVIVALAALPWLIRNAFAPLRPPVFEETATVYSVTESAYLTREAQLELSATSEMTIITPEDEILPGDPDYTPPVTVASGQSEIRQTNFVITETSAITGISSQSLERYSCASPSALLSGPYPPNQQFTILGWNVDLDNVPYLLIEDNPAESQVWLRIPDLTLVSITGNYLDTPTITCRIFVSRTATLENVATVVGGTFIAQTPALPVIVTVVPTPVLVHLEITEQDAMQQVSETVPELHDPQIEITPDGLEIRGYLDLPGPLGTTIRGDVEILTALVQEGTELRADVKSVTVAGRDITDTDDAQRVENAINNWLIGLFVRRDLQAFELLDGLLTIDVLERQFSQFPELVEQTEEAGTTSPTPNNTATLTATLIVRTVTATSPRTPPPVWTQTPSPTGQVTPTLPAYTATPGQGG